ncbi:unnamed protein product [Sphagnum troendelagicum]|uniref:Uncharacterized protein n=1 Tax=Sphagnum troendelagicum TaxID=128251 RepID=A0ABP0TNP3_9BRYO
MLSSYIHFLKSSKFEDAAAAASPSLPTQSSLASSPSSSVWTREQDKQFETALNIHDQDSPKRWENIAAMVPGKDATDVKRHFEILQEDVSLIDAGRIALPNYTPSSLSTSEEAGERRKGIPWSEEEHRLFLLGLAKFGKGDWRSISRNFVISRTPTQVASHAQKYFIRLNSINKDKRRSSIHDITSVNNGSGDTMQGQGQQGPITGQPALGPVPGQPVVSQSGMYVGPAPAMGSPVMLPPPGHVPFGARGHVPRPGMPGPTMPLPHMAYPMPQSSMHH